MRVAGHLAIATALVLASVRLSDAESVAVAGPATVEAAGYAIAQGVPEFATVVLSVIGRGETEGFARQSLDDAVKKLAAFSAGQGIPASDVFANGMVTVTRNRPLDGPDRLSSKSPDWYEASTGIRVTVRDISAVKVFSEGALSHGADRVTQTIYGVRDREALRQKAVDAAVSVATRNARRLAAGAGLTLGRIARISDPSSDECEAPKLRVVPGTDSVERVTVQVPIGLGPVEVCAKVLVTWNAQ